MARDGYVNNNTRLWCYRPDVLRGFTELRGLLMRESTLTEREIAVLVTATASAGSDSYCALAWGSRLAELAGDDAAAAVLSGSCTVALNERESALANWARSVVTGPAATTSAQVDALHASGLTDREIFDATTFVAFRLAFSIVDSSLGAAPDSQLVMKAPAAVAAAVSFGRRPDAGPA